MQDLLRRIRAELPALEAWQAEADDENGVYRFYHHSNKIFHLQKLIKAGWKIIDKIGMSGQPPDYLHEWYIEIYLEGAILDFKEWMNSEWLKHTRPILEAFWHTKYFIQMMFKYGQLLEPNSEELLQGMAPDWAAVLYLFELR